MSPEMEATIAIIGILFAVGGPAALLINGFFAQKPKVTAKQADINVEEQVAEEIGLSREERWRKYADDIEARLGLQISELRTLLVRSDTQLEYTREELDMITLYAEALRNHIYKELGPPPPGWPDKPPRKTNT